MKHEYHKGAEARKNFEDGMSQLFRAPKTVVMPKPEEIDDKELGKIASVFEDVAGDGDPNARYLLFDSKDSGKR